MLVVRSEDHRQHDPKGELFGGQLVRPFERPERIDIINARLRERGFDNVMAPQALDATTVLKVHDARYVAFLKAAWELWTAEGYAGEALPSVIPARRMRQREPDHIDGKLGYYCMAIETAITAGTFAAASASAAIAQTAQRAVSGGAGEAFAVCRPPGHHAARDLYGGYCFLNNAAIAAQGFRDDGAERVAVVDIDFHHGNGTQDIFYGRGDVLFVSLHGAPEEAFPHFLGYADETGEGDGEGANCNLPMAPGAGFEQWFDALQRGLKQVRRFKPDALVISLGVDTFKDDPISFFRLDSADFLDIGAELSRLGLPTLFVLEGGYALDEVGVNAVNVLEGYLNR